MPDTTPDNTSAQPPLRTLMLYWHAGPVDSLRAAIRQHLAVLELSPRKHEIVYYNVLNGPPPPRLAECGFDAVVFHNLALTTRWHPAFWHQKLGYRWLADLPAVRIAMPQDEYDHAEVLDDWMAELNVDVILSNFGPSQRPLLYPRMQHVAAFHECLTGYIDDQAGRFMENKLIPIADRPLDIVYRAAFLPYWFGSQGQLKHRIASVVNRAAVRKGLRTNISTDDKHTIVGHDWLYFLASSRATIGAESGSSVLDRRGEVKAAVRHFDGLRPGISFDEVDALMPAGWDSHRFFAISPRHLEAIATRTCQLLVEGRYDGILEAGKHYVPLAPDFSNLDNALEQLRDHARVQEMVDRTYDDVFKSGRYALETLCATIEGAIDRRREAVTPARTAMPPWLDELKEATRSVLVRHQTHLSPMRIAYPYPETLPVEDTRDDVHLDLGATLPNEVRAGDLPSPEVALDALCEGVDAVLVLAGTQPPGSLAPRVSALLPLTSKRPFYVACRDLAEGEATRREWTALPNVQIVHVADEAQVREMLAADSVVRPLVVVDDPALEEFALRSSTALTVSRADYQQISTTLLEATDLVTATSRAALAALPGASAARAVVSPEAAASADLAAARWIPPSRTTILIPGPLDEAVDGGLLLRLLQRSPDWRFLVTSSANDCPWSKVFATFPNVDYIGALPPNVLQLWTERAHAALLPLEPRGRAGLGRREQALELLEHGLPVVATRALSLDEVATAEGLEAVTAALEDAVGRRDDPIAMARRQALARAGRPALSIPALAAVMAQPSSAPSLDILVVYAGPGAPPDLQVFRRIPGHRVELVGLLPETRNPPSLDDFDVVIVHPSVRLNHCGPCPWPLIEGLRSYGGYKVAFLDHEYEFTELTRLCLRRLGFQCVHTAVLPQHRSLLYPADRFPAVDLRPRYSAWIETDGAPASAPLSRRPIDLVTRDLSPPLWTGLRGQLRRELLARVPAAAGRLGLEMRVFPDDPTAHDRAWFSLVSTCKVLLDTEGGTDVFDEYGGIRQSLEATPDLTFEEAWPRYMQGHEGRIRMSWVDAGVLEAIAARTALVLTEGRYGGLLVPDVHYLPLRRDLSNLDAVLERLRDTTLLERMAQRAYTDLIESGVATGAVAMTALGRHLAARVRRKLGRRGV